jgi:hypothetical protein
VAELKLDNKAAGSFTWAVAGPPDMVLAKGRRASITVTTGDRPATGIEIVQSSLQDPASRVSLGTEHLELEGGKRVPKSSTRELVFKVKETFSHAGTFTGSLTLRVDQQAATQAVNLTVYSSSWRRRAVGVFWIAVGILLSVFLGVYAKNKANRLEALRSAAALRERLPSLRLSLDAAEKKTSLPQLLGLQDQLEQQLTESFLDRQAMLPPKLPIDASSTKKLEDHLTKMAKLLAIVDEIVRRGIDPVIRDWNEATPAPYEKALKDLDALADPAKELSLVREGVDQARAKLPSEEATSLVQGVRGAPRQRTASELAVELENLRGDVWLVWAVVTVALGFTVLILSNPGFGTGLDMMKSFFWGLGLQVAGQQLQQLTPGKVASRFSLPVPKEE